MDITPLVQSSQTSQGPSAARLQSDAGTPGNPALRKAFDDFVGQTFFQQMLASMRKTVGKPAYLHGGHAEEVFQGQLDQALAEKMSDASADSFTGPMYDLFTLPRP